MALCVLSSVLLQLLLLAYLASLANAQHVNFTLCYADKVLTLNVNDTADDFQCFHNDTTNTYRSDYRPYLSLIGCYELCGHGYQLWPPAQTAARIALFILPLFILAGRYAFAPVGAANIIWTFVHLLGDPIDSLWSTLTRQEKARRNYHVALEIAVGASRDVAAVWTAYDQWWQDPVKTFDRAIKRNNMFSPNNATDHRFPRRTLTLESDTGQRLIPDLLTPLERYYIKEASHELARNRTTHLFISWIAIAVFLVSLAAAYVRTATTTNTNQTSHTLAVVMLFSFLVFAVYISGHVGNFREPEQVIRTIDKLHGKCPDLFPAIEGRAVEQDSGLSFSERYARGAAWAGINNSWRPDKRLDDYNLSGRSPWSLLSQSIFVILVAGGAAFAMSYLTPLRGVGCRSISWAGIMLAWIVSIGIDTVLGFFIMPTNDKSAKRLWWCTVSKDLVITIGSIILVLAAQIGYFNTCWCRASLIFRQSPRSVCIDLGPVTNEQRDKDWMMWLALPIAGLLLIFAAIFIAGKDGEGGRLLFIRTDDERTAEDKALENIRLRLAIDDTQIGGQVNSGHTMARAHSATSINGTPTGVPTLPRPERQPPLVPGSRDLELDDLPSRSSRLRLQENQEDNPEQLDAPDPPYTTSASSSRDPLLSRRRTSIISS